MAPRWNWILGLTLLGGLAGWSHPPAASADDSADAAAIRAAAEAFVKDFNAGKAEAIIAHFLPKGELIDDEGNVVQGREELQTLFAAYFAKYPGATLTLKVESVRPLGDSLAIEEGTRVLSTKEAAKARMRYVTVRTKADGQWRIASTREANDEPAPTPGQRLAAIDWLVGEWVSEGPDAAMKISYRWSEDKNFLLGEFQTTRDGQPLMKTTQRIGWDAQAGRIRSWVFDADGGFGEGSWTLVDEGWVIRTQATLPDGTIGNATVVIGPKSEDQFTIKGFDRIVGDSREDDFELTITRAPPAGKAKAAVAAPQR
jgi:uncharacterized protein (TIGR02246 family)